MRQFYYILTGMIISLFILACPEDRVDDTEVVDAADIEQFDEGVAEEDVSIEAEVEVEAEQPDIVEMDIPFKCTKNEDCADVDIPLGECQEKVCDINTGECIAAYKKDCCFNGVFFTENFMEELEGWEFTDNNMNDTVSWSVVKKRKALDDMSLYFGDPSCYTYYNGTLTDKCQIPTENCCDDETMPCIDKEPPFCPSKVEGSAISPEIVLPPIKGKIILSFYLWLDSEPLLPGIETQPDLLRVRIKASTDADYSPPLFTSAYIEKTTEGKYLHYMADISAYAGKTIRIKFNFNSIDGQQNFFEGVYLDNLKVYSECTPVGCKENEICADDLVECSDDSCTIFVNTGAGICAYPLIPDCVEPECKTDKPETWVACDDKDVCTIDTCENNKCVHTIDPTCCVTETLFEATFDDGTTGLFSTWTYGGEKNVKWQVSKKRSTSGEYSLYYGDLASETYDTPDKTNLGWAETPDINIPTGKSTFLSFQIFMSTEWDDAPGYENPYGFDIFEVRVVTDPVNDKWVIVWTSHKIKGTTNGEFKPVGVDLSKFAGKSVRVRFIFQTSDPQKNDYEGIYLDDILISESNCKRECMAAYDCPVDWVCTTAECKDNLCSITDIGGEDCCVVHEDCNDNDICTADSCIDNICYNEFVEGPGCCLIYDLASFNFDWEDYNIFSISDDGSGVKWHVTDYKYKSPPRSLMFGIPGQDYGEGKTVKGHAISPEITLPDNAFIHLSFALYLDVETDLTKDEFTVSVVENDLPTPIFTKEKVPEVAYKKWFNVSAVDLSSFMGKKVKIRFSFDSVDVNNNSGEGIFIDDILVKKVCP